MSLKHDLHQLKRYLPHFPYKPHHTSEKSGLIAFAIDTKKINRSEANGQKFRFQMPSCSVQDFGCTAEAIVRRQKESFLVSIKK
jgi:hypothetical protein